MVLTNKEILERRSAYNKEYRAKNREKLARLNKIYRDNNKEKEAERHRLYDLRPGGKKAKMIEQWKYRGLIHNDYDKLYSNYMAAKVCENCDVEFGTKGDKSNSWKTMDHSHVSGLFRNFLCNYCNTVRGD